MGTVDRPTVSVIIPARNEEKHIARCLESIVGQDYPKELMEVLVVDGMSGDASRDIVSGFAKRYPFIRLLNNPKQVTATALNTGILRSKGQLILRMDAHCFIERDYVRSCVSTLEETGADNVGGFVRPIGTSVMQEAIGFALCSFFGIGSGRFGHGDKGMFMDTVSFGAYRREVFERIGLYDEDALFGEDDDLNYRLTRNGGEIYVSPGIRSRYYPRSSLSALWKQYYHFGRGKVRTIRKHGRPLALRHLVPPTFVISVAGSLALCAIHPLFRSIFACIFGSYIILTILCSLRISYREGFKYLPALLVAFPTMHVSYGLGFLVGIFRAWLPFEKRGGALRAQESDKLRVETRLAINGQSKMTSEERRIRLAYSLRHDDSLTYSLFNPGHLFLVQQLERNMVDLLDRHLLAPLEGKKILDIGCGVGSRLRQMIRYGARPENLCGIDLLPRAVHEAKRISPNIDLRCGNAEDLPFEDGSFDMVTQFTVFTSILENRMKVNIGSEMLRVLKGDGIVLWYDYFVSKPTNRDVKGVGKEEIIRLFPNCTYDFAKTTLAPPIARTLAPYSLLLCYLLEKIPWLRTHYLVVIKKKEGAKK